MLANPVGTSASVSEVPSAPTTTTSVRNVSVVEEQSLTTQKGIAKIIVTNNSTITGSNATVLQKVVNPPLITVLNSTGPLTVVKSLCVTSGVTSTPQFTLVNHSTPLTVTNAGKSPTITLLNAPVALVKTVPSGAVSQGLDVPKDGGVNNSLCALPSMSEKPPVAIHNVFVKNTCPPELVPGVQDMSQGHKMFTASSFSSQTPVSINS